MGGVEFVSMLSSRHVVSFYIHLIWSINESSLRSTVGDSDFLSAETQSEQCVINPGFETKQAEDLHEHRRSTRGQKPM